jgi:GDP-L-fucose synthase
MISHINVGSGHEISIKNLAKIISKVVGFKGDIKFDITKPDGTPRKLMDSNRLKNLNWDATISLEEGLEDAYSDFQSNINTLRM